MIALTRRWTTSAAATIASLALAAKSPAPKRNACANFWRWRATNKSPRSAFKVSGDPMNSFAKDNFSQRLFSRLLVLFPRGYREEFGPHMSQLFKDCSREALALRGTTGLITLWLATLPDLFKTAFEENFKEITHMSKEKFHRLGKWAFVLGAALFLLAFVIGGMETSTEDPLGGPDALIEYFKLGIGPLAMLLFFVGIASLRSAYGDAAGSVAKAMLSIASIGSGLMLSGEIWWYTFFGGTLFMLLGIGVFGIYCMQHKVLPGINWLFALGGLTLPL